MKVSTGWEELSFTLFTRELFWMLQFEQCIEAGPAKAASANPPGLLLRIFLVGIATVHGIPSLSR